MIDSEDLVGNLGAPLRRSPVSGPYPSGSSSRREPSVGADPLLDWDADDFDDEDLEEVEIISHRPMLVGLGIDPNVVEQSNREPLWKREYDVIGAEGEEVVSLMDRKGKSVVRTPMRSARGSHLMGDGDANLTLLGRQSSKSTVGEAGALLVDSMSIGEDLDVDRDSRGSIDDFLNRYRVEGSLY